MNSEKKQEKESAIIDAAENVFKAVGFKNAKMDDIAEAAGITKVTLYSYFQSKENLYMSITFRALNSMIEDFNTVVAQSHGKPKIEVVLGILEAFMDFCSQNYLYSEALLDYFVMNRSSNSGKDTSKLTEAVLQSVYYQRVQAKQNLPFKILANEVAEGQKEGSIKMTIDPMLYTLHAWTSALGYIKIINSSGSPMIFNFEFSNLRAMNLQVAKQVLSGKLELNTQPSDQSEKNDQTQQLTIDSDAF